jgi:hypothetical protein
MVSNAGFLSIKFVDGTQLLIDQLADQHYYSFSLHATMEGYGFYENSVSLWTCVLLSGRLSSYCSLIHIVLPRVALCLLSSAVES